MSKRQSQPDSSHQGAKKPKINSVFRSAVPRVTPTANEPSSSRSTSRSMVITLSQSEDARRRASGRHRNRQQRPSTPNDPIPEPKTLNAPDPSEGISTAVMLEPLAEGIQNMTQSSKTNRKRNNNTAVSHCIFFLPGTLSNISLVRVISRNGSCFAKCFWMKSFDMTAGVIFSTSQPALFVRSRTVFISVRTACMVPS